LTLFGRLREDRRKVDVDFAEATWARQQSVVNAIAWQVPNAILVRSGESVGFIDDRVQVQIDCLFHHGHRSDLFAGAACYLLTKKLINRTIRTMALTMV
jgi:hypothetical protein